MSEVKRSIKRLELNRETISELSASEAAGIVGGANNSQHQPCPKPVPVTEDRLCTLISDKCPLSDKCATSFGVCPPKRR